MGEGRRERVHIQYFCNPGNHTINILRNVIVPKPNHPKALRFQPPGPYSVVFFVLFSAVLAAINFNNQLLFKTDEINHINPDWCLAPEFDTVQFFRP